MPQCRNRQLPNECPDWQSPIRQWTPDGRCIYYASDASGSRTSGGSPLSSATIGRQANRGPAAVGGNGAGSCRRALLGGEPPARRPVLRLQLLAPLQGDRPVVEVPPTEVTPVDIPGNGRSVWTRVDDRMRRLIFSAAHAPHDGRLAISPTRHDLRHVS